MPERPLVSVIMPVYNAHPAYLREAIESLLAQSFQDWELVIVEDPSEQSAEPLVRQFSDPRICYFLNAQRTSLAQQRNAALDQARASIVACLDADDICEPDRLQKQLMFLQQNPDVTVLGTQLAVIDSGGRVLGYRKYPTQHAAIVAAMPIYNPIGHPSVAYRRDSVLGLGGYKAYEGAEDYELWSRLALSGACFANHPEPLLRYRVHPHASKRTKLRETLRLTLDIKRTYWSHSMTTRARIRMLLEKLLLCAPPWLVYRLFVLTQYTRRRPG